MSENVDVMTLDSEVKRLADSLAIQWPGIDREDIAQEMMTTLVERWGTVSQSNDPRKIALGLAKKAGTAYCARERYYYQANTAEYLYTPAEVRALLAEAFFTEDARLDPPKRPSGDRQTVEADGISIALMDLDAAFDRLSESDQVVIMRAFQAGESLNAADRKRLQRAVDRVTEHINRRLSEYAEDNSHEGPGARRAMTNAQARYLTGNDY